MALLFLDPRFRSLDSTGNLLPGAKLYFYTVGTTTLKTVYTDVSAGTAAANPFILDSNGEGQVYGAGTYKVVCKDTDDVEQWTIESYTFPDGGTDTTVYVPLPTGGKELVDNCIVRGDSTTGIQESSWLISDAEVMTSPSGGNIVMADNTITGAELADISETTQAVTSTSNAVAIDYTAGAVITHTLTENTTIGVPTNLPASGKTASFTLELTAATSGSYTVAYNAAYKWAGGTAPTMSVAASAVDVVTCYTRDAGTTIYAFSAGQAMA
jgi:hypothetical protein